MLLALQKDSRRSFSFLVGNDNRSLASIINAVNVAYVPAKLKYYGRQYESPCAMSLPFGGCDKRKKVMIDIRGKDSMTRDPYVTRINCSRSNDTADSC